MVRFLGFKRQENNTKARSIAEQRSPFEIVEWLPF
jgi:hypothetical protein